MSFDLFLLCYRESIIDALLQTEETEEKLVIWQMEHDEDGLMQEIDLDGIEKFMEVK